MRIQLVIGQLNVGGAERQLCLLAEELAERGNTIEVITFRPIGRFWQKLQKNSEVSLIGLLPPPKRSFPVRLTSFRALPRLRTRISEFEPDVICAFLYGTMWTSALSNMGKNGPPLVWNLRTSNMEFSGSRRWKGRFHRGLCRILSRSVDGYIANSDAGWDFHKEIGYSIAPIQVIPNGIDTDAFRPIGDPELRQGLEFPVGDGPIIGRVGRLVPVKDYGTFLEAAQNLLKERPDARFVIVGGGPSKMRKKIQRNIEALGLNGKVHLLGHQDDLPPIYTTMDIHTSSSAYAEGFPNVVAESMACGVPNVVTDTGDSGKIVGPVGLTVPTRDPDAMAAAWTQMLEDPIPSGKVRERIVQNFSIDRMVEATESFLERIVALNERSDD